MSEPRKVKKAFFSPLFKKRIKKFTRMKRGYYSFIALVIMYLLSFTSEVFVNSNPLIAKFDGKLYFPLYGSVELRKDIRSKANQASKDFRAAKKNPNISPEQLKDFEDERNRLSELRKVQGNVRLLSKAFKDQEKGDWAIKAPYSYGPNRNNLDELTAKDLTAPSRPDSDHFFGTDDRGRDVFARMLYGFNYSMSFALLLTFTNYVIGMTIGAFIGYYGGKIDFFGMRLIEIWSSMPFLYTVMIISSIMIPNFMLLILILSAFGWMGITWYMRAEFFREKSKDYVQAAIAVGVSDWKIIFQHIIPNSLTPIISFLPFSILGGIGSLVSLDFLGFGLPAPTASWGEMLGQGVANLHSWWLVASPVGAMFVTLLLVTFIGEAIREAFDPKEYSRLR